MVIQRYLLFCITETNPIFCAKHEISERWAQRQTKTNVFKFYTPMTTAHGKPQKRALFFRLHFSLLTPRFLHRILRRVFTRFPRGKKYVRHILKQVGHILKYKAHIFSLLSCGCNALKKSFRFSAQKSCFVCLHFLYEFRRFPSGCHNAEKYAPAAALFYAALRYGKQTPRRRECFLRRGVGVVV